MSLSLEPGEPRTLLVTFQVWPVRDVGFSPWERGKIWEGWVGWLLWALQIVEFEIRVG